jgi:DUF2934 family protein
MHQQSGDFIVGAITGSNWARKRSDVIERPTRDEIARLAYGRYVANGRRNGNDVEDWLLAEQELKHHYA